MFWVFISVGILAILMLGYLFHPFFKKLFNSDRPKTSKPKKERKVKEKQNKEKTTSIKETPIVKNDKVEVIQNSGNLFEEESFQDPDTKINYANMDLGDFFEDEEDNSNIKNVKTSKNDDLYGNKFDEDFETLFEELRKERSKDRRMPSRYFSYKDELSDLMESEDYEKGDLQSQFEGMSDEMKALFLSDVLKRVDD